MPTYQYACTECGDRTEVVQKFSDEPLTVCSACSGRLRKVFSPVGIVFKGSGFYRTDSRSGNGSPAGAKEKSGDSAKPSTSSSSGSGDKGSGDKGSGDKTAATSPASSGSGSPGGSGSSGSAGSAGSPGSSGAKVA